MKRYEITFYGFIPSYEDFDIDWYYVSAENEDEALKSFFKLHKYVTKYDIKEIESEPAKA